MLKETFIKLLTIYTNDKSLINDLWAEIEVNYSDDKRYYHTLLHLNNLQSQICEVKDQIKNWETILFILFYHDIVYYAMKSDNEEKSAKLAEIRLKQINVPNEIIENCKTQILATKKHEDKSDFDTNCFIDADLSILGQDTDTYKNYFQNVRKEYLIYPDIIYNPGRKKVLKHFLDMERIFKTEYFYNKFENRAKVNLHNELNTL